MAKEVTIKVDQAAGQLAVMDGALFLGETAPIKFSGCTLAEDEAIRLIIFDRDGTTALADNSTDPTLLDLRTELLKKAFHAQQCDHAFPAYAFTVNTAGERTGSIDARGILPIAWSPSDYTVDQTLAILKGDKGDKGARGLPVELFAFEIEVLTPKKYFYKNFYYYDESTKSYYKCLKSQSRGETIMPPNAEYWEKLDKKEDICDGQYGYNGEVMPSGKWVLIYDAHNTGRMYVGIKDNNDEPVEIPNEEYWKQVRLNDLFDMLKEVDDENEGNAYAEEGRALAEEGALLKDINTTKGNLDTIPKKIQSEANQRYWADQDIVTAMNKWRKELDAHTSKTGKDDPHKTTLEQIDAYSKEEINSKLVVGTVKRINWKTPDSTGNILITADNSLEDQIGLWALPAYKEDEASAAPTERPCYIPNIKLEQATFGVIKGCMLTIKENTIQSDTGKINFDTYGCELTIDGTPVLTKGMAENMGLATVNSYKWLYYLVTGYMT